MPGTLASVKTSEQLTDRFRSEGLKVTPQRQAIFRILQENARHPTAERVHAEVTRDLPTVSLRTVYQTLNDLTAMGEIDQIDVGTGSARFDPNLEPHHHLVCDRCGCVEDLHVDYPQVAVPPASADGFEVTRTEIVFRGQCASCAGAAPAQSTPNTNTKES